VKNAKYKKNTTLKHIWPMGNFSQRGNSVWNDST
jgi:hypothetical protein